MAARRVPKLMRYNRRVADHPSNFLRPTRFVLSHASSRQAAGNAASFVDLGMVDDKG